MALYPYPSGCGSWETHSNKQKCVTRSSSEAEIVSAVDGMVIAQFYRYILGEFGYKTNVIHYEDNMSSMSRIASGFYAYDKKDRHIVTKINYMHEYFEKKDNNARMIWCPTHLMRGDNMTKDLHGSLFHNMEKITMGYFDIEMSIHEKKKINTGGLNKDTTAERN